MRRTYLNLRSQAYLPLPRWFTSCLFFGRDGQCAFGRQRSIPFGMDVAASVRSWIGNPLIFADDNMGCEWR